MIIAFKGPKATKPVLEIGKGRPDQVVIKFISVDEHITIHCEDGILVRTHYYPNKPKSTWDELRAGIAEKSGENPCPERHGRYVINAKLPKIDNVAGYHLVGRLIDLNSLNPRQHYINNIEKVIDAPGDKFMLTLYLSTKDNPCKSKLERVATCLGDVCFEISKPLTKV